ncbi:MAG: adenylyl-sulfate kinase [Saprospiraceae bacterium]|jgi:adenylyl-sulfate kinase
MENLYTQHSAVSRKQREGLLAQKGMVLWFTGLSGSGKSTLADALNNKLFKEGKLTYILDGDNIRQGLNKDLSFSDSDRTENIRRISEVAKLMADSGVIVLTAFISPFIEDRKNARDIIGNEDFIEVFVNTPLEVCESRDVKGLYKKARKGEIPSFTGISSPYEAPTNPDIEVKTQDKTIDDSTNLIFDHLKKLIDK